MLRGGAFKPRTSPYSFQGLGLEGLRYLAKARQATGLAVVTEAMSDTQVEPVAEYADMLQVGSRSMSNWALLAAVARSRKPVLLKRGMAARWKSTRKPWTSCAPTATPTSCSASAGCGPSAIQPHETLATSLPYR